MNDTKHNAHSKSPNDATKFLVALVFLTAEAKLKDRYKAGAAGGDSGISFGLTQSDAPSNKAAKLILLKSFKELIRQSKGLDDHLRTTASDLETLKTALDNHGAVNIHQALKGDKYLWAKINAALGADNAYSPEGYRKKAREKVDALDQEQLGVAAGYMNDVIERVGRGGAIRGVFSP